MSEIEIDNQCACGDAHVDKGCAVDTPRPDRQDDPGEIVGWYDCDQPQMNAEPTDPILVSDQVSLTVDGGSTTTFTLKFYIEDDLIAESLYKLMRRGHRTETENLAQHLATALAEGLQHPSHNRERQDTP